MMNAVKGASAKYLQDLEEEKKKKRKAQEEAATAAEANKEMVGALTQGQKTDNAVMKNKCFQQVGECQTRIEEKTKALTQV